MIYGYQSNLYQTIITFNAINELLAALAIFYIKRHLMKVIEAVHDYINGTDFDALVNKRVKKKLSPLERHMKKIRRDDSFLPKGEFKMTATASVKSTLQ